ncbi:MAG: hypothetical protein R8M37_00840 [Alphaproteobacteria bacterium]|nr:hypothetical protein [Alphaproteobacteria bacterium]
MLTKIDLCTMALLKLGEAPIQSLTDDSASAKLSRTLFDPVVDALLSIHPWRFATQIIELNKNTDGNFLIPSNVLRILKTDGRVIGNRVLSDSETVSVVGVVRTAPENFPGYFVSLVATRLAMEFCIPLTGDQSVFRTLVALYETELQTAKYIDSTTTVGDAIGDFSLINARF